MELCKYVFLFLITISLILGIIGHPALFIITFVSIVFMLMYILIYGYLMKNLLVLKEEKRYIDDGRENVNR